MNTELDSSGAWGSARRWRGYAPVALACVLLAGAWGPSLRADQAEVAGPFRPDPFVERPRVVVLTDIANEPDDQMSLVRLLVYANQFDIEGLVAGTSTWLKTGPRPDVVRSVLDAYDQVQPNLLRHAPRFPTAASLRAVVAAGQPGYGMASVGADKATPGSTLLLAALERDDPRPLWVLGWGGVNTLAQALTTARATRTPAQVEALVARLRVYTISDQDDAGPWMRREFPNLRYIATPSTQDGGEYYFATWTGISGDRYYHNAPGADFTTFTDAWVNANIRSKGPLGKFYPYPCCIHEGDTPTLFGLIDNGLASAISPSYGGWGGRYVWRQPSGESRPLWTQGGDSFPGRDTSRDTVVGTDGAEYTSDQATIWRWRTAFQHDFAARMDWTIKAPSEANHNPVVAVNGHPGTAPVTIDAQVGTPLTLDAKGTKDPDGHALAYRWFFYAEAGTGVPGQPVVVRQRPPAGAAAPVGAGAGAGGGMPAPPIGLRPAPPRIVVENASTPRATVWPKVPGLAHVILAVEDNGSPSLTSYRRVILKIAPAPPLTVPAPIELSAEQDHRRLLDLLGIRALRPGADGRNLQAPNAVNYDEAKAGPVTPLPDPLVLKDGSTVGTAAVWTGRRRAELLEDFDREIYGRVPAQVPSVAWRVTDEKPDTIGGVAVTTKTLAGRVDNRSYPAIEVEIEMSLTIPAKAAGPVPVMIEFGFRFPAGMPRPPRPANAPPEGPSWQEQVLAKGWGYAILYPASIQADGGAGLTKGIIGLVNKGQPRRLDDWGALRAWAWGASRALDYLETDKAVNAKHVGIEGMSRYGKAALVTMAYDQRFAIGYIASSGQGGAKLHRRRFGELVENAAGSDAYHWVAGNFLKYAGPLTANDLPVDQHELIALCAPRPVFISAGAVDAGDGWVNPKGMFLAAAGAGPVYRLLGGKDLGTRTFPPIETALVSGDVAFRQHRSGHTPVPNWPTFIAWAGRYIQAPAAEAGARAKVALTFDDLPVHGPVPPGVTRVDIARGILDALTSHHAPPTYGFVNANGLAENPSNADVLRLWREAGHLLGNHTWSHMDLHASTVQAWEQDFLENEPTLQQYMGDGPWRVLRFPYLHEGDTAEKRAEVARFLKARGYAVARVTMSFDDWAFTDPYARCSVKGDTAAIEWLKETYLSRAAASIERARERPRLAFGRDIPQVMLLHAGALEIVMLPRLLDLLEKSGFELVTLQDAQQDPAYQTDLGPLPSGGMFLDQVLASKGKTPASAPDATFARITGMCK